MSALREARAVPERCRDWCDRQHPESFRGVAIGAWRRYRAVDGPLESALLSLYIVIAILPAILVMQEHIEPNSQSLGNRLVDHYGLSAESADMVRSVFAQGQAHEIGALLFAVAGALFFGLGFGRVLQLVHARSWRLVLPNRGSDQVRYALVLLGVYGLLLLLLVQVSQLKGDLAWAVAPGWIALLVAFFVWAPRLLTHGLITRRALLPSAVITAVGIVVLMVGSRYVMEYWVDLYARDYGGLGVVMAVFFWFGFSSAIIVACAALAPALADRRELHRLDPEFHTPSRRVRRHLPRPHVPHPHVRRHDE